MVLNKKAKGRRNEFRAKKCLKDAGWLVEITKQGSRFEKNKDFFNLFDLIAIKRVSDKTLTKWIQVKSNQCPRKVRDKLVDFSNKYLRGNHTAEIWIWRDRKDWKIITI